MTLPGMSLDDPFRVSPRLATIKPSITLAVTARAAKLAAQGVDVVSFGAGEPDFDTPVHIKEAAKRALDAGETKYTQVAGTPRLRQAIAAELERAHGLRFSPEQIIVSVGAKQALYNLFMALLAPGDEVLVPAPYWVSYPDMVRLAGGIPIIIPTTAEEGFRVTPEKLRAALTPRTRAFVLCSPSNPTGACYDRDSLARLAPIFEAHRVVVVSDDVYRRLAYGGFVVTEIATLSPQMAALTVVVDGFSKTYSMTGWRLGYAAGPKTLIEAMATLMGQSTSNVTSFAQAAAVAALEGPQECVEEMRKAFDARRRAMLDRLRSLPGVTCFEPQGAFYVFPDLSAYLGRRLPGGPPIDDDVALCETLLDRARVAVVPGSGFGAPGHVRLSYATSMSHITRGLDRIGETLAELTR